ncbi:MAG: hypothetical protein BWK76_12430 [Desulfobulbaceae bacterium A2]|nr:MAG: hypothetical protein BWK76_12430 [Desulfobulbaceae bacterium A2]
MGCGCKTAKPALCETLPAEQRQILEALAKCKGASGTKDIAEATGLEGKQISCRLTAMKNKGYVASPERCKYEITSDGRKAIK